MTSYFKLSIILLTALMLCISTNIYAAKPAQDQTVTSAPLFGSAFACTLINVSDRGYEATITVYGFANDPNEVVELVPIGGYALGGHSFANVDFAFCEIKWIGKPGDFKASFCTASHCLEID